MARLNLPRLDTSMEDTASPTSAASSGDESHATMDKMPRHMHLGRAMGPKRPEIDLSVMMNVEQMKQLQVLMGAIMDEIQMQVRDNFDKLTVNEVKPTEGIAAPKAIVLSIPNPGSAKYRSQYGDIGIPVDKPDFDDLDLLRHIMKSHPMNLETAKSTPALTIPKSADEASANSKKSEVELTIASLTELKRDALAHFGKWRGVVFKRLQDIVIKNGGTGGPVIRQGSQHAPGNARRGGFSVRGSSARPPGKFFLCGDHTFQHHISFQESSPPIIAC